MLHMLFGFDWPRVLTRRCLKIMEICMFVALQQGQTILRLKFYINMILLILWSFIAFFSPLNDFLTDTKFDLAIKQGKVNLGSPF